MKIKDFIIKNKNCPCCENDLQLYLVGNTNENPQFWKGKDFGDYIEFKNKKDPNEIFKILNDEENSFIERYKSNLRFLWTDDFYLFYICNTKAIKIKDFSNDYDIAIEDACYYRSSPVMRCDNVTTKKIEASNKDHENLIDVDEFFSVFDNEKVYVVYLDYLNNKTVLWHYDYNKENYLTLNKKDKKVFEIQMPMIKNIPSFKLEDRDKLIERFKTWILIS